MMHLRSQLVHPRPAQLEPNSFSPPRRQLLTLREVARSLAVSVITVRRRIRSGDLAGHRMAGRLYVRTDELRAYIEKHREVPPILEEDGGIDVG